MSNHFGHSDTVSLLTGAPLDIGAKTTRAQHRVTLVTKRRKMSRRANLIGICGVSCLCILLLIATAQHRPLPASMAGGGGGGGAAAGAAGLYASGVGSAQSSGSALDHHRAEQQQTLALQQQQQQQQLQAVTVANMTATIPDVLAAQRAKIVQDMENFDYPMGRFGIDAEKLADMTPEKGGQPVRSIIITTWRSGSTFLGDILNAMPANYYHYEPLLDFGIQQIRSEDDAVQAISNLKNLLKCNYSQLSNYLEYGKTHTYMFEHNERLWQNCKEFPHLCWRAKFLTPFCRLFPMQSMKTVRLRLALAEQLLKDESLSVRIILLVRDPRGTMQSRKHRDWCPGNPDCDTPEILCSDLVDDYKEAEKLLKKYPSRFRTLRYEDLSISPYEMTQEILQFFGLPFDPMVEEFLDTHTKVNIGGVSSTYRDSKSAPFHWKQDLVIDEVKSIQESCTKAMELWGYRKAENFSVSEYQQNFDPLILPAPFA